MSKDHIVKVRMAAGEKEAFNASCRVRKVKPSPLLHHFATLVSRCPKPASTPIINSLLDEHPHCVTKLETILPPAGPIPDSYIQMAQAYRLALTLTPAGETQYHRVLATQYETILRHANDGTWRTYWQEELLTTQTAGNQGKPHNTPEPHTYTLAAPFVQSYTAQDAEYQAKIAAAEAKYRQKHPEETQ